MFKLYRRTESLLDALQECCHERGDVNSHLVAQPKLHIDAYGEICRPELRDIHISRDIVKATACKNRGVSWQGLFEK